MYISNTSGNYHINHLNIVIIPKVYITIFTLSSVSFSLKNEKKHICESDNFTYTYFSTCYKGLTFFKSQYLFFELLFVSGSPPLFYYLFLENFGIYVATDSGKRENRENDWKKFPAVKNQGIWNLQKWKEIWLQRLAICIYEFRLYI